MIGGIVMLSVIEDYRNEFKIKLPDDLEETVISFLNSTDAGNIYIGVDDMEKLLVLKIIWIYFKEK